jgi:hypothetical protein
MKERFVTREGVQPPRLARARGALSCLLAAMALSVACGETPATTPSGSGAPTVPPASTLPAVNPGAAGSGASGIKPPAGSTTAPVTTTPPASMTTTPMTAPPAVGAPTTGILPCGVSKVLVSNCQTCHAAKPIAGAPMALVTFDDLHKPAVTKPTMQVYQLVQARIHDTMRPMPPTTQLTAPDLATLDTWLNAGALTGPATDAMCATTTPVPTQGSTETTDGSRGPLVPGPGETCYDFKVHQSNTMVDDVKYDVGDGEHYEQFYYKVPWGADVVATGYGTKMDNAAVLHHWLLFATDEGDPPGSHKTSPLPTLIGTNPQLLAGWAVGGPNVVPPKDVGFELPGPGKTINVQWHFYNSTNKPQSDASSVQICTLPKAMRQHVGSITWAGTEDLGGNKWFGGAGMPPHKESTYTTNCVPGRAGLAATDSIHIIGFEPHMHRIGKRMQTSVKHAGGMMESIFDKPFSFGNETHYFADYELKAGDSLVTSCTFNNDTDNGVPFGESSDTEMCYQFTFHWPAHSLSNGAASLLGVTDTCW